MIPLHDRTGIVVGFLHNEWITDRGGRALAIISEGAVWNRRGSCIGWWNADHLRGLDGGVVAFIRGARSLGIQIPIAAAPARIPRLVQPMGEWPVGQVISRPANRLAWSKTDFGFW